MFPIEAGDIILFSRQCLMMPTIPAGICMAAKLTSFSPYDHVGIVVERVENNEKKLFILEANMGGVTCLPLIDRLKLSKKSNLISVRKLINAHVVNPDYKNQLSLFVDSVINSGYNTSFESMTKALFSSYLSLKRSDSRQINFGNGDDHFLLPARERSPTEMNFSDIDKKTDIAEQYYCSQLVATALVSLGMLHPSKEPHLYIPSDFSSSSVSNGILHSSPFVSFSPDIVVDDIKGAFLKENLKEGKLEIIRKKINKSDSKPLERTNSPEILVFHDGDIMPLSILMTMSNLSSSCASLQISMSIANPLGIWSWMTSRSNGSASIDLLKYDPSLNSYDIIDRIDSLSLKNLLFSGDNLFIRSNGRAVVNVEQLEMSQVPPSSWEKGAILDDFLLRNYAIVVDEGSLDIGGNIVNSGLINPFVLIGNPESYQQKQAIVVSNNAKLQFKNRLQLVEKGEATSSYSHGNVKKNIEERSKHPSMCFRKRDGHDFVMVSDLKAFFWSANFSPAWQSLLDVIIETLRDFNYCFCDNNGEYLDYDMFCLMTKYFADKEIGRYNDISQFGICNDMIKRISKLIEQNVISNKDITKQKDIQLSFSSIGIVVGTISLTKLSTRIHVDRLKTLASVPRTNFVKILCDILKKFRKIVK